MPALSESAVITLLLCDGTWDEHLVDGMPTGVKFCNGTLSAVTPEQLQAAQPELEWGDVSQLRDQTIILFCIVFGFLVLKKVLFNK